MKCRRCPREVNGELLLCLPCYEVELEELLFKLASKVIDEQPLRTLPTRDY